VVVFAAKPAVLLIKKMRVQFAILWLLLLPLCMFCCDAQNKKQKDQLSQDFDKSPPIFYNMPKTLTATDTSAGWNLQGQKILITGRVLLKDAKTPAANVILYYYQTNTGGRYVQNPKHIRNMPANKLGQTHGYIRGWVKTNKEGRYSIYTIKPGSYPNRNEPAHIHFSVIEPNKEAPYYIDDVVFDDDILLTTARRMKLENRGGSGVVRFVKKDNLLIAERDIILGLNLDSKRKVLSAIDQSGIKVGEDLHSFTPHHAYGPDKGTRVCPICKYGWYNGVIYFVGNQPDWPNIKKWLVFLESQGALDQEYLKVYFVYANQADYNKATSEKLLNDLGNELSIKYVALTYLPSFLDKESGIYLNKINPSAKSTFFVYKRSNLRAKFVNLKPTQQNFERLKEALAASRNQFFALKRANSY
jgi:protocatechuate 3,4-dioxygenase beta subunit